VSVKVRCILCVVLVLSISLAFLACGDDSSDGQVFNRASDVYAGVVKHLEQRGQVLHAVVTSTQSDNPTPATAEFWVDEANDVAREDRELTALQHQKIIVQNGQKWFFVGLVAPNHSDAPNCDGIAAPATSLLLGCEGLPASQSQLVGAGSQELQIKTTGTYASIGNKPWSITLTLDAQSLLPVSLDSDLWAELNGQPYEVHETQTYKTDFVDRDSLPTDFFEPK
jgi:hypothetical protein